MSVTGKQVETAVKIMNLAFEANNIKTPNVAAVVDYAARVAYLLAPSKEQDTTNLEKAIVERMVTIRAEVK